MKNMITHIKSFGSHGREILHTHLFTSCQDVNGLLNPPPSLPPPCKTYTFPVPVFSDTNAYQQEYMNIGMYIQTYVRADFSSACHGQVEELYLGLSSSTLRKKKLFIYFPLSFCVFHFFFAHSAPLHPLLFHPSSENPLSICQSGNWIAGKNAN